MPAKEQVSLLPKEEFEKRTSGRFLIWALSTGRWIVVLTEFIVICAFLSRFYLDRQVADLHDEIFQKQAIVEAMSDFEQEFRFLQEKLEIIDGKVNQQDPSQLLALIAGGLPSDVFLTSIDLDEGKLAVSATALSQSGLRSFWEYFKKLDGFENQMVVKVIKKEEKIGIDFEFAAELVGFAEEET